MDELKPMKYVLDENIKKYIIKLLYDPVYHSCLANATIDDYIELLKLEQEIVNIKINHPKTNNEYLNNKFMSMLKYGAASAIYNNDPLMCLLYNDEILKCVTNQTIKTNISKVDYLKRYPELLNLVKGNFQTLNGAATAYHNNIGVRFITNRKNIYDTVSKNTLSYALKYSPIKGYISNFCEVTNSPFEQKSKEDIEKLSKKSSAMFRCNITNMLEYATFTAANFVELNNLYPKNNTAGSASVLGKK